MPVWRGLLLCVLQRCADASCANHADDDKCKRTSVYRLAHGMCSGYSHVIDEPKAQVVAASTVVGAEIIARCRRKGGRWKPNRWKMFR